MTGRLVFVSTSILVSLLLSFAFLLPQNVMAQTIGEEFGDIPDPPGTQGLTVGEQYNDIQEQGLIFAGICTSPSTPCECRDEGRCTLNDVMQVVINITIFILGISGSLVLVMFVYGGVVWLTSAGSPDRVKTGVSIMTGAITGLIIIFGAYAVVTLLINVLKTGKAPVSGENLEDVIGGNASDVINTSNQ